MKELRSVINLSSYGNISIRLTELIEERGITRYRLAKLADTRFEVVEKWCSGTIERIEPLATDHKVVVAFDRYGSKTLLANYAKLTKI